ncbi:TMhelix containing protein [Vibrio phage 1.246.O._10N.261.54.E10]|nr:TMhelix containing protein [Vibrio phage 1.246.O._10N.261.54.E10]
MSTPLHQVAIAVVTAGCVSFASAAFYAGQQDKQIQSNTNNIAEMRPQVNKIPVIETNQVAMQRRLDTYERLVIDGQKEILKEISAIRVDYAKNATEIGAIKVDISEIKETIRN